MTTRWKIALVAVIVLGVAAFVTRKTVTAAPQAAAPAKTAEAPSMPSGTVSIPDTTLAINSSTPMSQRIVHYEIDAKYNAAKHTIDANEVLTYHNLTGQALDHFPFHLYQNAFQPNATWVREAKRDGSRDTEYDHWDPKEYGSEEITSVEVVGQGDLTKNLQYISPDDGNKDDRTVVDLKLAKPIAPNAFVQFKIAFHEQMPETQARSGWKRDFLLGGQWFPKVGVFWHGAWNCHQYHATTEFFSDFGTYNVRLTAPRNYIIGASGVPTGNQPNSDGTKTLSFYGEDIHDFAFAASPNFVTTDAVYLSSLGPVQIHILALAAHPHIAQRYLATTRASLQQYEQRYGPYPYRVITVIDPEPGAEMEGMEYPTLFTADGSWWGAFNGAEVTAEHEFGHQYWYGMVATNEFEEAWLDEGINSYSEVKVLAALLGNRTSVLHRGYANLGDGELQRISYLTAADY